MKPTLIALTLLAAVLAGPAVAGTLPSSTVLLVEIDDVGATLASFEGSAAQRVYREVPAVRQAVDKVVGGLGSILRLKVDGVRTALGLSNSQRDEILAWPGRIEGRIALALVPTDQAGELRPLLRYEAKSKAEAEAVRRVLVIAETALARAAPQNPVRVEEGVSVLRNGAGEAQIAYAMTGRELLLAQGPHLVRLALEAEGKGRWEATLSRAVAATGGGSGLRAWADVGGLARIGLEGGFDEGGRNLLRVLDALGVRAAAWSSVLTRSGGRDALHLVAADDSLLRSFAKESAAAPWPGSAPAGTLASFSLGAAPQDLLALWMGIAERTDAVAFANAQLGFENLLAGLGVDVWEDLLGQMGEGCVLHLVPDRGGVGALASAPVRDRQKLLDACDMIAMAADWRRTEREDGILWINTEDGTGFLLREKHFWIGKVTALAALNAKPVALPAIDAIRDRLPGDARGLVVAAHENLARPLRKALANVFPAFARLLDKEGELGRRLGAEALALVPSERGVTILHESTVAPAGTWLLAAVIKGVMSGDD